MAATSRDISPPPLKRLRVQESVTAPLPGGLGLILYSWNINGISPFIQPKITSFFHGGNSLEDTSVKSGPSLRDFLLRRSWPTFLLLQEVKINPEDKSTIRAVEKAVNRQPGEADGLPEYTVHMTLPTDTHNARGFGRKVYGVCTIARKDFADKYIERMRGVAWDAEGRFSVTETKAADNLPKIAIFNVYLVNGTDYEYKDSLPGMVTGTRHDRKLTVHQLLSDECHDLMAAGFLIIIAGDCNIARTSIDGHPRLRTFPHQHNINRQDFEMRFFSTSPDERNTNEEVKEVSEESTKACQGLGMVDTFRSLHPERKGYSYYPRGVPFGSSCDRVDMILCSGSLASSCSQASILATPGDRGTSDHVPIHATFKFADSTAGSCLRETSGTS